MHKKTFFWNSIILCRSRNRPIRRSRNLGVRPKNRTRRREKTRTRRLYLLHRPNRTNLNFRQTNHPKLIQQISCQSKLRRRQDQQKLSRPRVPNQQRRLQNRQRRFQNRLRRFQNLSRRQWLLFRADRFEPWCRSGLRRPWTGRVILAAVRSRKRRRQESGFESASRETSSRRNLFTPTTSLQIKKNFKTLFQILVFLLSKSKQMETNGIIVV